MADAGLMDGVLPCVHMGAARLFRHKLDRRTVSPHDWHEFKLNRIRFGIV